MHAAGLSLLHTGLGGPSAGSIGARVASGSRTGLRSLQTMETQVEEWCKEAGELQVQAAALAPEAVAQESVGERQSAVGTRIVRLIEPLKERRRVLLASKELHQVTHDLEDEIVSAGRGATPGWGGPGHSLGAQLSPPPHPAPDLGPGPAASGHSEGARGQPADGAAVHQEEPGERCWLGRGGPDTWVPSPGLPRHGVSWEVGSSVGLGAGTPGWGVTSRPCWGLEARTPGLSPGPCQAGGQALPPPRGA